MKIEKLPSGSYRVRKMYKGHQYALVFDHKPSQKELAIELAAKMQEVDSRSKKPMTFDRALDEYIESRSNVISPATVRSYKQLKRMYSDDFKNNNIYDINDEIVQKEINRYAANHSSKSVKNFSGLISATVKFKRKNYKLNTKLPEKDPDNFVVPKQEDVVRIIDALDGTPYHIAIQLACLGLRRSEILALTLDDLDGNTLTINKARVINENNEYVGKKTKRVSSARQIYIPDNLANEIRQAGVIYDLYPGNILRALHRTQDQLGIPRCKLHELRHFYVTYAHNQGMSDANVIATIGHKSDAIMKKVYRHAYEQEKDQIKIAASIFTDKKSVTNPVTNSVTKSE